MPWLRLYVEIIDDDKLGLLAFEDRWHYIALLCCKRTGLLDADCNPDLLRRRVALKLGLSTRELDEVARRLSEVQLIDRETLQPNGWEHRQFESDSSTERVRRYRERMGSGGKKRKCNVSETAQDTDTDTDTEKQGAKAPVRKDYPPEFEQAWADYPRRHGGANKAQAHKAWQARTKAGFTAEEIHHGVLRYAAYIRAAGKEHTEFVKQPETFFGPGCHFRTQWPVGPAPVATAAKSATRSAVEELQAFARGDAPLVSPKALGGPHG